MNGNERVGPIDRFLRLFTDVRTGESGTALLLTLNIFLILAAYSVMKVVREPLILASGGVDIRAYSAAGQAIVLLGAVPLYAAIAARVPRRKLINIVTAFFIACLVVFYALALLRAPVGAVFYIWLGIFNVMVVAQFWSFANDVYTEDEGKRLFPIVVVGASTGAVFGAWLPGRLLAVVGVYEMLLISGFLLIVAALISTIVDSRERRRTEAHLPDVNTTGTMPAATGQYRAATGEFRVPQEEYKRESGIYHVVDTEAEAEVDVEPEVESTGGAFQLVFRSRYLLLIAILMLLLNWVNTTGENILFAFVQEATTDPLRLGGLDAEEYTTRYYSNFQTVVNIAGLFIQLFLVSRVLKYFGIGFALLVLPIVAMGAYALIFVFPVLSLVRWGKTAENATDYSLQNTTRHALFLPTTREEKYKAKQAIDSFFQRAGDVMAGLTWFVGTQILMLRAEHFALVNVALIVVWLVIAVLIGRRYSRLAAATQ